MLLNTQKWHRWIGFSIALIVLLLCVTGILLNHTSALGLGKRSLPDWAVSVFYDVNHPPIRRVIANNLLIERALSGAITVDGVSIAHCEKQLIGAVAVSEQIVVACAYKLVFLTGRGELLEEQGQSLGIPMPLVNVLANGSEVLLVSAGAVWRLDPRNLKVAALAKEEVDALDSGNVFSAAAELDSVEQELSPGALSAGFAFRQSRWGLGRLAGGSGCPGLIWLIVTGYLAWRAKLQLLKEY